MTISVHRAKSRAALTGLVAALALGACSFVGVGDSARPDTSDTRSAPDPSQSSPPTASARDVPSPSAAPSPQPQPTGALRIGISLDQARDAARQHEPSDAELRSYAAGPYFEVVQFLFGPRMPQQPPAGVDWQTMVWGLVYVSSDRMVTVYVDFISAEILDVSDEERPDQLPERHRSEIVFDPIILNVNNSTTLAIDVYINQVYALTVEAGGHRSLDPNLVSSAPWDISLRTSSGRELISVDNAAPGMVWHTTGDDPLAGRFIGRRLFLSCGQLLLWSGGVPSGPAPGPSYPPHDCDP